MKIPGSTPVPLLSASRRRRSRMPPGIVSCAAACVLAFGPARAEAQSHRVKIRLSYLADAQCPIEDEFLSALATRSDRFALADPGQPARAMQVRLSTTQAHAEGTLELEMRDGSHTLRRMDGETCRDVASALALVAALALESEAGAATEHPRPATPPVREKSPAVAPKASGRWASGVQAAIAGGVAPSYSLGVAAFVEFEHDRPDIAARLSVLHLPPAESEKVLATIGWTGVRMEGCWPRLEFGRTFAAAPCAGLGVASIRTSGTVGVARSTASLWMDASLLGHLKIAFLPGLWLDGVGGAVAPLRRFTFEVVNPGATLWRTPPVAGWFGVGLGVQIP